MCIRDSIEGPRRCVVGAHFQQQCLGPAGASPSNEFAQQRIADSTTPVCRADGDRHNVGGAAAVVEAGIPGDAVAVLDLSLIHI